MYRMLYINKNYVCHMAKISLVELEITHRNSHPTMKGFLKSS